MTEINKNDVKFNKVNISKVQKSEAEQVKNTTNKELDIKQDYKEAAAAPGAEAAGRAQIMIGKSDNIDADIKRILANPAILDRSEAYYKAAERAGLPYPVAATFATQEVV